MTAAATKSNSSNGAHVRRPMDRKPTMSSNVVQSNAEIRSV